MINSKSEELKNVATHKKNLSNNSNISFSCLKKKKLLPHIKEEYSYRITNRLLIQKIMHPKRDKNITDSLLHTTLSHTMNNRSQIIARPLQCRRYVDSKKHYPSEQKIQASQSKHLINQSKVQNYDQCKNRLQKSIVRKYEFQRHGHHLTSRQKCVGKILKNNFLGCQTAQTIGIENNLSGQSGFVFRQKKNEGILAETTNSRSIMKRNPKAKANTKFSIQLGE